MYTCYFQDIDKAWSFEALVSSHLLSPSTPTTGRNSEDEMESINSSCYPPIQDNIQRSLHIIDDLQIE